MALGNFAGATLVASIGALLMVMVISGQLNNYLRPLFRPWAFLTGALLVSLAVWTLASLRRDLAATAHDNPMRKSSCFLLVPLIIAVVCAPSPLGAAMVNSSSIAGGNGPAHAQASQRDANRVASRVGRNADGTIAYEILSADGVSEVTLEDLANRFTFGRKADLEGRRVTVVGFLSQGEDSQWRINRFKIYCCAADAVPYSAVLADETFEPQSDQWFEITGTLDTQSSDLNPVLHIEEATPISQPEIPYL